jgi:hypothetical protein
MPAACCATRQSLYAFFLVFYSFIDTVGLPRRCVPLAPRNDNAVCFYGLEAFLCMRAMQAFLYRLGYFLLPGLLPCAGILYRPGILFLFMHFSGAGALFSLPTGGGRICGYPSPCPWRTLPYPSALVRGIPFGFMPVRARAAFFLRLGAPLSLSSRGA